MDRFSQLLPPELFSLFKEHRYKVVVYPVMVTYYLDKEMKYDAADMNKKIKKLSKLLSDYVSKELVEDEKLQTNLLDFFKNKLGPELHDINVGVACHRLFKSRVPYYRNFERMGSKTSGAA